MTQYIVSDPCYLINEDKWDEICKKANVNGKWDDELFKSMIKSELEIITQEDAYVENTGYGDWDNTLYGIPDTITKNSPANDSAGFYADAGMVCVCKLVSDIEDMLPLDEEYGTTTLGAIFEAEGKITVKMDISDPEWTVVRISDEAGNHWHTMESPFSDDEGECED